MIWCSRHEIGVECLQKKRTEGEDLMSDLQLLCFCLGRHTLNTTGSP